MTLNCIPPSWQPSLVKLECAVLLYFAARTLIRIPFVLDLVTLLASNLPGGDCLNRLSVDQYCHLYRWSTALLWRPPIPLLAYKSAYSASWRVGLRSTTITTSFNQVKVIHSINLNCLRSSTSWALLTAWHPSKRECPWVLTSIMLHPLKRDRS